MEISLFNYHLPEYLIAKFPSHRRDESNLLIYFKENNLILNGKFKSILDYVCSNDIIIANNVKVIPARIFGKKETGGRVEVLLVEKISKYYWKALIKASKKISLNSKIYFNGLCCKITDFKYNEYLIEFERELDYNDLYEIDGQMPIPPYLKREENKIDKIRYQTVFSDVLKQGTIAAPTAGLHFTQDIIKKLAEKGVPIYFITLYVGLGTFTPVRVENITEHKMHSEIYEISDSVAYKINQAKREKKKIIAVGTTTVRALESNFKQFNTIKAGKFDTDIFIYPGFKFNVIDKLITNFHLPKSTLLMLVSAFAGRENILKCYEVAKSKKYKFFSYGDSMFIM